MKYLYDYMLQAKGSPAKDSSQSTHLGSIRVVYKWNCWHLGYIPPLHHQSHLSSRQKNHLKRRMEIGDHNVCMIPHFLQHRSGNERFIELIKTNSIFYHFSSKILTAICSQSRQCAITSPSQYEPSSFLKAVFFFLE